MNSQTVIGSFTPSWVTVVILMILVGITWMVGSALTDLRQRIDVLEKKTSIEQEKR